MTPGPQSLAAKVAFEKYFLWKARDGYVEAPVTHRLDCVDGKSGAINGSIRRVVERQVLPP